MLNPEGVSQVEAWQENCPRKGQNLKVWRTERDWCLGNS